MDFLDIIKRWAPGHSGIFFFNYLILSQNVGISCWLTHALTWVNFDFWAWKQYKYIPVINCIQNILGFFQRQDHDRNSYNQHKIMDWMLKHTMLYHLEQGFLIFFPSGSFPFLKIIRDSKRVSVCIEYIYQYLCIKN